MIIACGLEIQMSDLEARKEEAAEMQMWSCAPFIRQRREFMRIWSAAAHAVKSGYEGYTEGCPHAAPQQLA